MQTLLSQFCRDFHAAVEPLLGPLGRLAPGLARSSPSRPVRELITTLEWKSRRLQTLVDKVAAQRSFILIFGSLKGGKSTLLNALTGSCVNTSELAHPCRIHVSYAGKKDLVFARNDAAIESEYRFVTSRLAQSTPKWRRPAGDDPLVSPLAVVEAHRRVSVKTPTRALVNSGAVLVDNVSPQSSAGGQHSHANPVHDPMDRFRDAATCAVFVVKTDHLFDEPILDELKMLLNTFLHVFLVINLDGSKVDLLPDGTLTPSLERNDPKRIIQAFRELSMNCQVFDAARRGDLRIYAIDLLAAASRRLRDPADRSDMQIANVSGPTRSIQEDGLANLLKDMIAHLDRSSCSRILIRDGLVYGSILLEDLRSLTQHPELGALHRKTRELKAAIARLESRRAALKRLQAFDWEPSFAELRNEFHQSMANAGRAIHETTKLILGETLNAWFASDESVHHLTEDRMSEAFACYQRDVEATSLKTLGAKIRAMPAGLNPTLLPMKELAFLGIGIDGVGFESFEELHYPTPAIHHPRVVLQTHDIPLRKPLGDRILFRTRNLVRRRLFGPRVQPDKGVREALKRKYLGTTLPRPLVDRVETELEAFAHKAWKSVLHRTMESYRTRILRKLRARLVNETEYNTRRLAQLHACEERLHQVLRDVARLERILAHGLQSLGQLARRHQPRRPTETGQAV